MPSLLKPTSKRWAESAEARNLVFLPVMSLLHQQQRSLQPLYNILEFLELCAHKNCFDSGLFLGM